MVSSPDPSLSHEEKRSGEPIRISGYRKLLRQCNLATFNTENELEKKEVRMLDGDEQVFCCNEVLHNIKRSHWFLQLLGNEPKKFRFVHQTRFSSGGARGLGTGTNQRQYVLSEAVYIPKRTDGLFLLGPVWLKAATVML